MFIEDLPEEERRSIQIGAQCIEPLQITILGLEFNI